MRLVVATGPLAAVTGGGRAIAHLAAPACGPASARTIAGDRLARVYADGGSAYGCVAGAHRAYHLGAKGLGLSPGGARIEAVRVAGRLAAYGLRTMGLDTGYVTVNVRSLSTGALLTQRSATTRTGVEGFQSINSLVPKAEGALAWIATAHSIGEPKFVRQLLALDRRGLHVLDSGPSLGATSLALHGSTISWKHGTTARTATLRCLTPEPPRSLADEPNPVPPLQPT
jgi:hypothetical protein